MRVYFHTFGCKANQYDTDRVRQAVESVGGVAVDDPAQADAAVVNSCTVTHVGESKMRGLVRRLHRRQPDIRTVVMGCAAALDDGTLAALPGVRGVVRGADPSPVIEALGLPPPPPDPILRRSTRGARAWIKIQDGCDEHCTFCATTLARGGNRSRSEAEIVAEARALADQHVELVLTGVHIGTYGHDTDDGTLSGLVATLVQALPHTRFRLSSVEATEVDDRLADVMVSAPRSLAPHLHAPLQSGSDRVLKRMGRHWYTAARYRSRIERLAASVPHLGLGADIIVGFPGETAADHRATCQIVRDLPFTYLHVFPYSERPGVAARRLGPPIPAPVAAERCTELRELVTDKARDYHRRRVGTTADTVVLGRRHGRYRGLTEDYLDVYLADEVSAPARLDGVVGWGPDATMTVDRWSRS